MSEFHERIESEEEEEEEEDVCQFCSFAVSGNTAIHQAIYLCETCSEGQQDNKCCCVGCMHHCHKDHEVSFLAFGHAYCDCGQAGCALYKGSTEEAQRLLDNNYRTADPAIINATSNYAPIFTVHDFQGLQEEVDLLKVQALDLTQQSKDTFWVSQLDTPRCHFEDFAKRIGYHHVFTQYGNNPFFQNMLSITGYEWWIQVKPSPSQEEPSASDDLKLERGNVGVDLHYDKDEEMASSFEIGIFPTISTVTYLTESLDYCHPTVVYSCTADLPVGAPIMESFITLPEIGKHVAFDGKLLHGAPAELLPFAITNLQSKASSASSSSSAAATGNNYRITFLVNVWVGHRPSAVQQLPSELVSRLNEIYEVNSVNSVVNNAFSNVSLSQRNKRCEIIRVKEQDAQRDDLGEWITIPFVSNKAEWGKSDNEAGLDLNMWVPQYPVEQYVEMSQGKGKKRRANDTNEMSSDKEPMSKTYHFQYLGENAAARLDYEDEEGEDDLLDDLEGM